jgi:laccase
VPIGLAVVFHVEEGTTPGSALPAPPADWVGKCDAQHYAAAALAAAAAPAEAPSEAPSPALAPGPAAAQPRAMEPPGAEGHKQSGTLPQRREHTRPSDSSGGLKTVAGPGFFSLFFLFFVLQ